MKQEGKTVLVLGGGVGGLVVANELLKQLPRLHQVVLIERATMHLFYLSLLWLMIGQRKPQAISRPLDVLAQKGIEVVHGEITALDAATRAVQVDAQSFGGDYLIVSLGAELAPEMVPGLAQAGYNLYTLEGMETLHQALSTFKAGKLALVVASLPYKCPAAPYEAAMLLEYFFRKRHLREQVELDLYAGEPGPMGVAGPQVSRAVRDMVEQKGIHYFPDQYVTRVDPHARQLSFASGLTATYDLLAFVPPHRVPRLAIEAGLAREGAWVLVDRCTLETRYPGVYAIGDIISVGYAQHAAIILILRLIEGEQPITLCLENRLVDRQGLPFAFVDRAHIDGESKLAPGRLHLAAREEEALHCPRLLPGQEVAPWHAFPLPQACQKDGGTGQSDRRGMVGMHAGLTGPIHEAGTMLANEPGHLQPRFHPIGQEPVLQAEREAFNAEDAGCFTGLPRTRPRFSKFGWLAIRQINQQDALSFLESLANVPPICVSASSGCAAITRAS